MTNNRFVKQSTQRLKFERIYKSIETQIENVKYIATSLGRLVDYLESLKRKGLLIIFN